MSDPPVPAIDTERLADLRSRAASRLAGAAATKGSIARSADALAVLHTLASSPATASDALAVLHELQVHQVELDLQAQELDEARAELEAALRRHVDLYNFQPVGCFTIDPQMILHEMNQTGADMLEIGPDDALGLPLAAFIGSGSVGRLRLALSSLEANQQPPSCLVELCPRGGTARWVLASMGKDPAANRYLVSLMDAGDEEPRRGDAP